MKSEAHFDNRPLPYVYSYYNVSCYFDTPLSKTKSTAARILNSIIDGLNTWAHLLRYILIIPDTDIIEYFQRYDYEDISDFEICSWMVKQIKKAIEIRLDDLHKKRPGAILTSAKPRIIGVKMIPRPAGHVSNEAYSMISKFNNQVQESLRHDSHSHWLTTKSVNELKHFEKCGKLSELGKRDFWAEINEKLKRFNRKELDLLPFNGNKIREYRGTYKGKTGFRNKTRH